MSDEVLIPVPSPMSREHAVLYARQELGEGSVVGINHQYPDAPLVVGVKSMGDWIKVGFGKTWEEAFANVREVKYQRANRTFVFMDDEKEQGARK